MLEFFAFLRLKYVESDTERPFVVPFGRLGAWAITLPKIVVLLGVLIAQKRSVWVLCGLFNVVVSSVYLVWRRFHPAHQGTCAYDRASTTIPTMYGTSLSSQPVVVNSS